MIWFPDIELKYTSNAAFTDSWIEKSFDQASLMNLPKLLFKSIKSSIV
jgi:hypothetical protein